MAALAGALPASAQSALWREAYESSARELKPDRRASAVFIHAALIGSLILQRFCIYVGGSPIFFALPIFLAAVFWAFATGRARISQSRSALYVLFTAAAVTSAVVALGLFDKRIAGSSPLSLLEVLIVYLPLAIRPTNRFNGSAVLPIFCGYARLIAVLGLLEYAAQFAGIRLFSFLVAVPSLAPVLAEPLYNFQPYVAYGSEILRSNGFVLVEPSVFSQVLALGIVVDGFYRRQWRWLPLYGAAYVFTYAGTGILSLAVAALLLLLLNPRDAPRILPFALMGSLLAAIGALAFPSAFSDLVGRSSELSYSGSSGYARYVSQFDMLRAVAGETRQLIGYGPGAFERASFYLQGGASAALKLLIDYGVLGLITFSAFLIGAWWRRDIAFLSLFALVNFQLGGGYLLFTPYVVLVTLLCAWSSTDLGRRR